MFKRKDAASDALNAEASTRQATIQNGEGNAKNAASQNGEGSSAQADIAQPSCVQDAAVIDAAGMHEATDAELAALANKTFRSKVSPRRWALIYLALFAIIVISLCLGRYSCNPADLFGTIYHAIFNPSAPWDEKLNTAIFNIRVPRVLCVVLVGAALSVAGASYQGMFKNPLVSPDLLGASAGASFGACLGLLTNSSNMTVQILAFFGALLAVSLAVWLTRMVKSDMLLGLVLGGILVGSLFQSGTSIIKLVADADDKLPAITFWLMGSFANITLSDLFLVLAPMLIGFALLLSQRWNLNVMSFGEEEARALGINTKFVQMIVILGATLITACSVAIAGVIGYVGLVVPHLARAIVGPNYKVLLPASMVIGSAFLLIVDIISRMLYSTEIPIGILTSILGVPFFVFIYRKNLKGW